MTSLSDGLGPQNDPEERPDPRPEPPQPGEVGPSSGFKRRASGPASTIVTPDGPPRRPDGPPAMVWPIASTARPTCCSSSPTTGERPASTIQPAPEGNDSGGQHRLGQHADVDVGPSPRAPWLRSPGLIRAEMGTITP